MVDGRTSTEGFSFLCMEQRKLLPYFSQQKLSRKSGGGPNWSDSMEDWEGIPLSPPRTTV